MSTIASTGPEGPHWSSDEGLRGPLDRCQSRAWAVGGVGLAVSLAGCLVWPDRCLPAYLVGYVFWTGIALGCLGLTMLHHLVGGSWGLPVRRPMEAGGMALLPLAVLFLPIALGMSRLYPWARAEFLEDAAGRARAAYLNGNFFLGRTAFYFAAWIVLALLLRGLSNAQDRRADHAPSHKLQLLSGPGLAFLFLSGTFAAIDWMMSLEPHWASTVYGALVCVGETLAALAMMIVVIVALSRGRVMSEAATAGRLHDLGNLVLAFTMLWAYMSFAQYLIVWAGNLPEEVPWYLRRTRGGWQWVALALALFHFFLPFFVLLFRESKRQGRLLFRVAVLVLAMHWLDLLWLIAPASAPVSAPRLPWAEAPMSLAALAGIGGVCAAVFLGQLRGPRLVPLNDPNLNQALEHAGG